MIPEDTVTEDSDKKLTIVVNDDLSKRVLGQTADLFGRDLAKGYEWSRDNIHRVLKAAAQKLGNTISEDSGIHPRVVRRTIREALDTDNQFAAEYFGGILASSRKEDTKDDSAIPFLKTLERLSTKQIKLHFVTHYLFAKLMGGVSEEQQNEYWKTRGLFVELSQLRAQFDGSYQVYEVLSDLEQLVEAGVIGESFSICDLGKSTGNLDVTSKREGLHVTFTAYGLRLFQRALGQQGFDPHLLPITNIEACLSSELQPNLTRFFPELFTIVVSEPNLETSLDDVRFEHECAIDEVKSELDPIRDRISQLEASQETKGSDGS